MKPEVLLIFLTRFPECTQMLAGITQYQRSQELWSVFLDDEARAERDPAWLRSRRWKGVISRHTTPVLAKTCATLDIPLVDLNDCPRFPGVPKIRPDNVTIGHLGAEHFLERGFTHFGFCGFSGQGWAEERRDGFLEALRLAGQDAAVLEVDYPGELTPAWDARQTARLVQWVQHLPKPAAVMACNDLRAIQLVRAAQTTGLLVPEEIAVLGANNGVARCELVYPPLSSVAANPFQSGLRAAEWLAQLMAGHPLARDDERIDPVGVVTRLSTDILAISDKHVAVALSFIREHACRGITVDEVVTHTFVSRSLLEMKFRRVLGRSPQAEIRRTQMAKIRQLLVETDLPLKQIAEVTGFEHTEYLSVVFKRFAGISPGEYRKRSRSGR
ncbi:XylR family transcriptional regulator [Opitutus terrae]|uniref:Transcriptional regulator, AraC family n=1 Tax=Opitutus terrae (strain DSM 11246 / JCM 15787 / PB90-1) TaxID=452637 RepID=B1ZYE2_OPITP|nr:DNA-binding transcriptional regulator [Opitutus terrae]ACB77040.1 transcriptional regulator, AraC family [Opitutus terrae PB90-1]